MQSTPDAGAALPSPTPTTNEVVHRPDPGLARGVWEASPAFFWIVLSVATLGTLAVFLVRNRLRTKKANVP